jgi:hypothetical protein
MLSYGSTSQGLNERILSAYLLMFGSMITYVQRRLCIYGKRYCFLARSDVQGASGAMVSVARASSTVS